MTTRRTQWTITNVAAVGKKKGKGKGRKYQATKRKTGWSGADQIDQEETIVMLVKAEMNESDVRMRNSKLKRAFAGFRELFSWTDGYKFNGNEILWSNYAAVARFAQTHALVQVYDAAVGYDASRWDERHGTLTDSLTLNPSENGEAILKEALGWKRWSIDGNDVNIHTSPKLHPDFFYGTITYKLDENQREDVQKISGSIYYYPVGNELTAGCHFAGAGIVSLWLAIQVAEGGVSVDEARSSYGDLIEEVAAEQLAFDELVMQNGGLDGIDQQAVVQALSQTLEYNNWVVSKRQYKDGVLSGLGEKDLIGEQ